MGCRNLGDLGDLVGRLERGWIWDGLAICYTLGGYGLGLGLILVGNGWVNGLGVVLLTHCLVLSAYLAHEFMHGAVLSGWNELGGNLMLWLNGGCYVRFEELRRMHLAHHVNRIDYCRFDIPGFLRSLPGWLRGLFLGLEWLYIPALAFLLRIRLILAPFLNAERRLDRSRMVMILIVRVACFVGLAILSLKALLLYFLAYIGMIHLLRLMDAFQHTYDSLPVGMPIPEGHKNVSPEVADAHEQANTFSNVISRRYRGLNLLLLNFGYHNAHHAVMTCPWYRLPDLDEALYGTVADPVNELANGKVNVWGSHYLTLPELIGNYHRFRVSRIWTGQGQVDPPGENRIAQFYGATEVSFLVVPV